VEDLEIFLTGSGSVQVYMDGDCFDGDLLALESLAKIHGGVAHPVEAPEWYDGTITEVSPPDKELSVEEPVVDWSEDHLTTPSPAGGVSLTQEDLGEVASQALDPISAPGLHVESVAEHPVSPSSEGDTGDPPGSTVTVDTDGLCSVLMQGNKGRVGPVKPGTNPYEDGGSGLSSAIVPWEAAIGTPNVYGYVMRKHNRPSLPMVLHKDLGNMLDGMPRHAGTTIVGRLRPDTGGTDPRIPDHIMWRVYADGGGKSMPPAEVLPD